MTGLIVLAAAMAGMTTVGFHTDLWWARGLMFIMGIGLSGVFIPTQAASMATISSAATGRASTLFNAQRQLGGAIGVAVLTTVLAALHPLHVIGGHASANLGAYHGTFLTAAAVAVLAAGCAAVLVRDADASSTMTGRHADSRRRPSEGSSPRTETEGAGLVISS